MKMKFGRLLAAGKSMVSGNVAGRYQMQEGWRLPQFISPKNPFAAEATAAESASPPMKTETSPVVSAVTPGRKLSTWLKRGGAAARQGAAWCLDHNPFSSIGRPRLPAMPRFGRPPVQAELSLEKVTVVRGDLVHADLEVVPAGGDANGTANTAWRNLTARVFSGGNR
jgi:hypothetical protein